MEMTPSHRKNKEALIHEALHHKGVVISAGLPEHIIEHLAANGWKIKRRKKWKRND
jgi:hypothetical protein